MSLRCCDCTWRKHTRAERFCFSCQMRVWGYSSSEFDSAVTVLVLSLVNRLVDGRISHDTPSSCKRHNPRNDDVHGRESSRIRKEQLKNSLWTILGAAEALRLCTAGTAHRGSRGIGVPFLDHGTRRGWGVSVTPRPLFTPGKDPVPILQEAGWAPGPVWTVAENFASNGIRSPHLPARSQSLYRMSYPAHIKLEVL
jgi:hypothetical protein